MGQLKKEENEQHRIAFRHDRLTKATNYEYMCIYNPLMPGSNMLADAGVSLTLSLHGQPGQ